MRAYTHTEGERDRERKKARRKRERNTHLPIAALPQHLQQLNALRSHLLIRAIASLRMGVSVTEYTRTYPHPSTHTPTHTHTDIRRERRETNKERDDKSSIVLRHHLHGL